MFRTGLLAALVVLAFSLDAHAQLAVDADTIALWHFDEPSGLVAYDSSLAGRDFLLTRYPSDGSNGSLFPTFNTAGCFGGALHLEQGTTQSYGGYGQAAAGFAVAQNALTVEAFIRTTNTEFQYYFLSGTIQLDVAVDYSGYAYFQVGDGDNWAPAVQSDVAVRDGLWHYVASTYDGAQQRVFVDGVEHGNAAFIGTIGPISDFLVGGRPSNTFFEGEIDEVRVSSVARSAQEIASNASMLQLCPEPAGSVAGATALLSVAALRSRRKSAAA